MRFLPHRILAILVSSEIFARDPSVTCWRQCTIVPALIINPPTCKAHLHESAYADSPVLHSDNGAPVKGATLQRLGVIRSFSRPAVSNDNPHSEPLFSTRKGRPSFPGQPFEGLGETRRWAQGFELSDYTQL